jgi:hypothetical protein
LTFSLPLFLRLVRRPLWQSGAGLPSNHAPPQGCIATAKISAGRSLATLLQSCILHVHSIRRLNKLPIKKTAIAIGQARQGGRQMHDRVFNGPKNIATKIALATLFAAALAMPAQAQKKYDPGATDTEIKIGNIMPYSGPASAYATIGKTEKAYFDKLNSEGGINGRKINFIS